MEIPLLGFLERPHEKPPRICYFIKELGQKPGVIQLGQKPHVIEPGQKPRVTELGQKPGVIELGEKPKT